MVYNEIRNAYRYGSVALAMGITGIHIVRYCKVPLLHKKVYCRYGKTDILSLGSEVMKNDLGTGTYLDR